MGRQAVECLRPGNLMGSICEDAGPRKSAGLVCRPAVRGVTPFVLEEAVASFIGLVCLISSQVVILYYQTSPLVG